VSPQEGTLSGATMWLCLILGIMKPAGILLHKLVETARSSHTDLIRIALYQVGAKCSESFCCCACVSGNAAMPAIMPTAMNKIEMIDQITPQHCDEPP
jgi:hypothetical protein